MQDVKFKSLFGIMVGAVVLAITIMGLPQSLRAQSSLGSLSGSVLDATGAVIPGATVRVTNVETNVTVVTKTTGEGIYSAPSLVPGEYKVTADKQGFETGTVTSVVVFGSRESTANVTLQIGSASVQVTVEDKAALISPTSSETATTVEYSLFHDLPIPEADVSYALLAVAGFQGDQMTNIATETPPATTGWEIPDAAISVGGNRMGTTPMLVDGSDNTLTSYAREGMIFSAEEVQEISVLTSGVPAQYGRSGGGLIQVETKGGTNNFHGELMFRHTDPSLQAFGFNSTTAPQLHENFFGIYVGGPAYIPKVYDGRNKTWFFVDVEPYRDSNLSGGQIKTYTPDELAGNEYNAYNIINTTTLTNSGAAAALAGARTGGMWYQYPTNTAGFPIGSRYSSASQYVAIPAGGPANLPYYVGAQLAANPLAKFYYSGWATPQSPTPFVSDLLPTGLWENNGNNAWSLRGVLDINNRYGIRIDQQISNTDHLFVRWGSEPLIGQREGFFSSATPYVQVPWEYVHSRNLAINEVHTFGSQVVNELHGVFLRTNFDRTEPPLELSKDWGASLGLFPAVYGKGVPALGGTDNNVSVGQGGGFDDIDQSMGAGDDFTVTRGRHIMKFGVDFRHYEQNYYNNGGVLGGSYGYSASSSNNGTGGAVITSEMLGELSSYSNTPLPVPEYYRWHYYGGYAQDDIKLLPHLTANVGLRWEMETPRIEKYNHQGTFMPNLTGTVNGTPTVGAFCFSGACGLSTTLWPDNYRGFEPRLGLSYALRPNWTWRASYDIMRAPLSASFGYGNNPDFNVAGTPIGGQYGGTNANAWVNVITNPPITPSGGFPHLSGGPYYTMYQGVSVAVPYVPQSNVVPSAQTWQIDTQYQFSRNDMLEVAYLGNHGEHLLGLANATSTNTSTNIPMNNPSLATVIAKGQAGTNFTTLSPNPLGITTATGAVVSESPFQSLEPYQGFFYDDIDTIENRDYDSEYNALYLTWTHRNSHGLTTITSFSWDKLIDDSPEVNGAANGVQYGGGAEFNGGSFQNPYNLHGERAWSLNDIPWKLATQYSYKLPIGQGRAFALHNWVLNDLLGNWVTGGYFITRSGIPMAIATGSNGYWQSISPTNGNYGSYIPPGYSVRPSRVPGVPLVNTNWRQDPLHIGYLNPAALAMPGSLNNPGFGTVGRTICCAPRITTMDMSLQKHIPLGKNEDRYLQLEGDATNVFNHPTFYFGPNTGHFEYNGFNYNSIGSTTNPPFTLQTSFAYLGDAVGARLLQLALRFVW